MTVVIERIAYAKKATTIPPNVSETIRMPLIDFFSLNWYIADASNHRAPIQSSVIPKSAAVDDRTSPITMNASSIGT